MDKDTKQCSPTFSIRVLQGKFRVCCKSQPCSWPPHSLKQVQFAEISNIDFTEPTKN